MGLGDVKLMCVLGLFFGFANILIISIISFLIGAIISIILLIIRRKRNNEDEYIPFGPFISIGAFTVMFVPYATIINILFTIFTLGLYRIN